MRDACCRSRRRPVLRLFVGLFLVVPAGSVMVEAFRDNTGHLSMSNISTLLNSSQPYLHDYMTSLELSAVSAALAGVIGLVGTVALVGSPSRLFRQLVASACGVLANTGGVPLAFAFIASIGNSGVVTELADPPRLQPLRPRVHALLLRRPRHRLPVLPAAAHDLADAAAGRGVAERVARGGLDARRRLATYWRKVGLPVLAPPFIATLMVLFMDAFAAYATAEVLTTGVVPLVPLAIGQLLDGNVVANQVHLGDALGFGMVVIVIVAGALYVVVQRRTSRWLR